MDLRGMLNDNGPAASTPSKPPPPAMPSTPVQTNAHQPFRDYSQTQPSPGRHISLDYSMQQAPPGAFASPPPYHPSAGPYPNRPAPPPPPLQQISPNDLRSPSIAPGPGPSPYRPTPTSSISAASGGYPFPQQQQTPTSPVQRHQYPPQHPYHRDSFPQPAVPVGVTGPPGNVSYMQGQQVPQTPPVATPGGHPYPHQRSQSTHSTPTPTSAHSQHAQYGAPFVQGSPVATHHPMPQMDSQQQRQSSQPPTPVAAPLSRQTIGSFGQPPSPYQQRLSTIAPYPHPPSQRSPPQPLAPALPPSLSRHQSNASIYDPIAHSQESHRRSQSQSQPQPQPPHIDRDRSISVSPKTRVPSLPGSAGRPPSLVSEPDPRQVHLASAMPGTITTDDRDRAMTPAKRKLDDRELRPDELERRETRPPPFEATTNGRATRVEPIAPPQRQPTQPPPKRRKIYKVPPVWAQTLPSGREPNNVNYELYKPNNHGSAGSQVNGKADSLPSRHPSPEERRVPAQHAPVPAAQPAAVPAPPETIMDGPLGPWEPSITGTAPQAGVAKAVADWLFNYVVCHPDINQIQGFGVHFEIEAKLGTLIDRNTKQRVENGAVTECILNEVASLGFRSSMSEGQHKAFNEFLNTMVLQAHPDNKDRTGPRVPIKYKHRREIDKFFEIPPNMRNSMLPACVSGPISKRGHQAKVRVTYDQKTNEVLAKIVKARVADISLHMPEYPLDCRISINLEMDWDGDVEELERLPQGNRPPPPNRNKDRLSYNHGPYQVDLTQVIQVIAGPGGAQRHEKEHELEIEMNADIVLDQGNKAKAGLLNQYYDLVEGFINNIRVMTKKAGEFPGAY
ncbi:hypothetical protein OQA88_3050 [Cercophora sp. LCS_1]